MRIQLNTTEKTIKLEESIEIGEFIDMCKKLFPNNMWRGFTLETNTTIEWINPIPWTYPTYKEDIISPVYIDRTWITCAAGISPEEYTVGLTLNPGIYCIDYQKQ